MPSETDDETLSGPEFRIDSTTFLSERRPTREQRQADGRARRAVAPPSFLAAAPDLDGRPDPIAILRTQESVREPFLVPLRYQRMAADPFAFLRGAAAIMASDLSRLPTSGIAVQLCGDAHISNFGMFASAERTLVFDVNDFDETLPGPFDWDVRRLAASAAVAARARGASDKRARRTARAAAAAYRGVTAYMSGLRRLDAWNVKVDADFLLSQLGKSHLKAVMQKATAKSRRSTGDTAVGKLTEVVDGERRFRSQPPLLIPVPADQRDDVISGLAPRYEAYLHTLAPDRLALLAHYSFIDLAHKVVGVGSVGTLALVMLLESGDGEPLLLQIKQANASVLEPFLGASRFRNAGKRVVVGQRVMQAAGDPFLGWMSGGERLPVDFYVRQLRDLKGSVDVSLLDADALTDYAAVCGALLARAHARVGDSSMVSGYLGEDDAFDDAMADFALAYADVNAHDHALLVEYLRDHPSPESPSDAAS
jgi:uncharacterized protein (DUF2252 family)